MKKQLTVTVEEDIMEKLIAFCEKNNRSISNAVSVLLGEILEEKEDE